MRVREIVAGAGRSRTAEPIDLSSNTTWFLEPTLNAPVTASATSNVSTPLSTGATDNDSGVRTKAPHANTS